MQLAHTAWVESLNIRDDGWEKTYRSCQKHESLSLHGLVSTGRHLLGFFVYNKRGVKFFAQLLHITDYLTHYKHD